MKLLPSRRIGLWLVLVFLAITAAVYWPGLQGGYLFDDYPNIVDNHGVQPHDAGFSSLVGAALSSPASDFKRPLASLSFAANYLATGLDPYWMKLTNLVIHLLNGSLVFLLARALLQANMGEQNPTIPDQGNHNDVVATLISGSWLLLPINLTGVLYVVQRMESMANLFVLLGLIGYIAGRRRMLAPAPRSSIVDRGWPRWGSFILSAASITLPAAVGILAKETAVMLPLYALLVEWTLFGFRRNTSNTMPASVPREPKPRRDRRILGLFMLVLVVPMIVGVAWLLPGILNTESWASRNFTLTTRLLSEARIIVDYIVWTLLPTPGALSFYHDNFRISQGLLTPWTTLASIILIAALITLMLRLRRRWPLAALGIALFLGCQLLTGTILPLELIYEHRNYFASFGLLLAVVPMLAAPRSSASAGAAPTATVGVGSKENPSGAITSDAPHAEGAIKALPMAFPRYALLAGLLLCWTTLTALTAYAWGNPRRLAEDLAVRAPQSPRAQYELGRTYIIYSHYDPASPFTQLAYAPLERSAALPDASILPEQALIFMNARMHLPLKDAWWGSMITKLGARRPGVQDESSLAALTQCAREQRCDLPRDHMVQAFLAALAHPAPSARLLATYGDYAWNVLDEHALGERMIQDAVNASPNEPAYQITLIRMLAAQNHPADARAALKRLEKLNIGGRLHDSLVELHALPGLQ